MNMVATQNSAWYRQPIMWLVVAVPAAAVLFGIVMLTLALNTDDGLVVDDYYKRGLEINRSLERDKFAAQIGVQARIDLNTSNGEVVVDLHWPVAADLPRSPELSFLHATREQNDRRLVLRSAGRGKFHADLPDLAPGRWYVRLETPRWRLQKVVTLPQQGGLVLTPNTMAGKN